MEFYHCRTRAIKAMNSVAPQLIIKKTCGSFGGRSEVMRYGQALIKAFLKLDDIDQGRTQRVSREFTGGSISLRSA